MSDEFDFEEGDRVRIRHRERGTTGCIVAKIEATCTGFYGNESTIVSSSVRFELPWGDTTSFKSYQAEFEVINDEVDDDE